jgi:hypothetical protein
MLKEEPGRETNSSLPFMPSGIGTEFLCLCKGTFQLACSQSIPGNFSSSSSSILILRKKRKKEGRREGRKEGRMRGREEGRKEGKKEREERARSLRDWIK